MEFGKIKATKSDFPSPIFMEKILWKFESGSKRNFATFRLIEDSERKE
jgi:hypothetical protein